MNVRVLLKDIASFSKGEQINGEDLLEEGAFPYLNGGIRPSGRWSDYNTPGNTITISEGGNSCGYVNLMTEPFWCGAHCYYLYDLSVDVQYLYFALKSQQSRLMGIRSGACMPNIKKNDLGCFELTIHTEEAEQKYIVEQLLLCQTVIEQRQLQLLNLDSLVKARFVEMFGDIIHNTMRWPQYVFSEIASSRLGKMLDAKQQTGKYQFPYLANFNVQWFRFELRNLNKMDFDEKDQAEFELKDGDLIVCEGGEIGRCAIWHNEIQPCYFQKALHRVRCNTDTVIPEYLARWFQFNCEHGGFAAIEGAKATIAHLPGAKLKALQVAVPPLDLQKSFAAFVSQVDKSKLSIQASLDQLETLKQSLMQKYFG